MGFSTSGSAAVLLIGLLLAASVLVPTMMSLGSTTGDAFGSQSEQLREQTNTGIEIDPEETDAENGVTVVVANEGTLTLGVRETDVLVNGYYVEPDETTVVDRSGDRSSDTNLWQPGTDLEIVIEQGTLDNELDGAEPERVQVSTQNAIADAINLNEEEENG